MSSTENVTQASGRIVFLGAVMDLCWLCPLFHFIVVATTGRGVPLKSFIAAYGAAVLVTFFFKARGGRRIWPLLGHLSGFGLMCVTVFRSANLLFYPQTPIQWYEAVLFFTGTGLFWIRGRSLGRRKWTYYSCCNHFDAGFSLLFALLFIRLLIHIKAGPVFPSPLTLNAIFLFFLSGSTALFLAGSPSGSKKEFSSGFQLVGPLLTAIVLILAAGAGLVFLYRPLMASFAGTGYTLLKQGLSPLGPPLVAILRFLFAPRGMQAKGAPLSGNGPPSGVNPITDGGEAGWLEILVGYGLAGLLILMLILVMGWLLYLAVQYLFSRQPSQKASRPRFFPFSFWRPAIWFRRIKNWFSTVFKKIQTAGQVYQGLVLWGKRSGVKQRTGETPAEYAARLCLCFSPVQPQIRLILKAFELELYGGRKLSCAQVRQVREALKNLGRPSLWWMRFRKIIKPG